VPPPPPREHHQPPRPHADDPRGPIRPRGRRRPVPLSPGRQRLRCPCHAGSVTPSRRSRSTYMAIGFRKPLKTRCRSRWREALLSQFGIATAARTSQITLPRRHWLGICFGQPPLSRRSTRFDVVSDLDAVRRAHAGHPCPLRALLPTTAAQQFSHCGQIHQTLRPLPAVTLAGVRGAFLTESHCAARSGRSLASECSICRFVARSGSVVAQGSSVLMYES
jgi:hypothetical protein